MKLNCKQLLNEPGTKMPISGTMPEETLGTYQNASFAAPAAVEGVLENRAGVVTLRVTTVFRLSMQCDRCLKPFQREFRIDSVRTVVQSCQAEHDDYLVTKDGWIDLAELTVLDLLLELPTKQLCTETCQGLCPVCGCDRNESDCNCITLS